MKIFFLLLMVSFGASGQSSPEHRLKFDSQLPDFSGASRNALVVAANTRLNPVYELPQDTVAPRQRTAARSHTGSGQSQGYSRTPGQPDANTARTAPSPSANVTTPVTAVTPAASSAAIFPTQPLLPMAPLTTAAPVTTVALVAAVSPAQTVFPLPAVAPAASRAVATLSLAAANPAASAVPAPVNTPPLRQVKRYTLKATDLTIRAALARWLKDEAYQDIVWDLREDLAIDRDAEFEDDLQGAIGSVMLALRNTPIPTRACVYSNKVVRVIPATRFCNEATP